MNPRAQAWLVNAALWLAAALTLFPLAWMVSVSLMPTGASSTYPPPILPTSVTLDHYRDLFAAQHRPCFRTTAWVADERCVVTDDEHDDVQSGGSDGAGTCVLAKACGQERPKLQDPPPGCAVQDRRICAFLCVFTRDASLDPPRSDS